MFNGNKNRSNNSGSPAYGLQCGGSQNTQFNLFELIIPVLTLTIPGLLLSVGGLILIAVSFLGWMSIIFRLGASDGNIVLPGPILPSGIPLAACYFISFMGGVLIFGIGRSMATSADSNRFQASLLHAVAAALIAFGTMYGINWAAADTQYKNLLPHFSSCSWESNNTDLPFSERASHPPAFRSHVGIDEWVCER